MCCQGNVKNDERFSGEGAVGEDKASPTGIHTMLEILPMTEAMNCLILTHLQEHLEGGGGGGGGGKWGSTLVCTILCNSKFRKDWPHTPAAGCVYTNHKMCSQI